MSETSAVQCVKCQSKAVVRSRRRGLSDHMSALFGRWPYRCRNCGAQFRGHLRHPEVAFVAQSKPSKQSRLKGSRHTEVELTAK